MLLAGGVDRFLAAGGGDGLESKLAEEVFHQREDGAVVVDDENGFGLAHFASRGAV